MIVDFWSWRLIHSHRILMKNFLNDRCLIFLKCYRYRWIGRALTARITKSIWITQKATMSTYAKWWSNSRIVEPNWSLLESVLFILFHKLGLKTWLVLNWSILQRLHILLENLFVLFCWLQNLLHYKVSFRGIFHHDMVVEEFLT